jgi:hypothetical protein
VAGQQEITLLLSGFPRRDPVTVTIVEAFGPGNDYTLGTGEVNASGALELTLGAADHLALPADLAPGLYTIKVTGTRVAAGASGPAVASAPILVAPVGSTPTPVGGK